MEFILSTFPLFDALGILKPLQAFIVGILFLIFVGFFLRLFISK